PPISAPHSFPTRRSSDLDGAGVGRLAAHQRPQAGPGADHVVKAKLYPGEVLVGSVEDVLHVLTLDPHVFGPAGVVGVRRAQVSEDRKSTRLNSSHVKSSY